MHIMNKPFGYLMPNAEPAANPDMKMGSECIFFVISDNITITTARVTSIVDVECGHRI